MLVCQGPSAFLASSIAICALGEKSLDPTGVIRLENLKSSDIFYWAFLMGSPFCQPTGNCWESLVCPTEDVEERQSKVDIWMTQPRRNWGIHFFKPQIQSFLILSAFIHYKQHSELVLGTQTLHSLALRCSLISLSLFEPLRKDRLPFYPPPELRVGSLNRFSVEPIPDCLLISPLAMVKGKSTATEFNHF